MKKLLGTMILSGAALLMVSGTAETLAQSKKGAKGTIELIESSKDGKFRFTVRNAEGKYIGGSIIGHATEKEARAAAEDLKTVLANATYVSKKSETKKKDEKKDEKKDK